MYASDSTMLSLFSGDKSAWPLYGKQPSVMHQSGESDHASVSETILNIDDDVRRQPSSHAFRLVAYLASAKFDKIFTSEARARQAKQQLFHTCVVVVNENMADAGLRGRRWTYGDGSIRDCRPFAAAWIADGPEQHLIANVMENHCVTCPVPPNERGKPTDPTEPEPYGRRRQVETILMIVRKLRNEKVPDFKRLGLRKVNPFWANLPHTDVHRWFGPDLAHQLHKGLFGDHTVTWSVAHIGEGETDNRFKVLPSHPTLKNFKKGISAIRQWTIKEYKRMEAVYPGVVANAKDGRVVQCVRALIDLIMYTHFDSHTDDSLAALERALAEYHIHKQVFDELGIHSDFNFKKMHDPVHYSSSIRWLGCATGTDTENTERLHIDYAKFAWRSSSKKDFFPQMINWLRRREAAFAFHCYQDWLTAIEHAEGDAGSADSDNEDEQDTTTPSTTPARGDARDSDSEDDNVPERNPTGTSFLSPRAPFVTRRVLAKVPGYPHLSVLELERDFGAVDFLAKLTDFLTSQDVASTIIPSTRDEFDAYKRMTMHLPAPLAVSRHGKVICDPIRATRALPARGRLLAESAVHDVVLIRKPGSDDSVEGAECCGPLDYT
jgi:hypothetical protein